MDLLYIPTELTLATSIEILKCDNNKIKVLENLAFKANLKRFL